MKQLNKQSKRLLFFAIAFFTFGYASAQIEVSGKLTDAKGKPIDFADVVEVGTNNGTLTDSDGAWTLTVKSTESVLEFAFVGFETKKVKVGNQKVLNVSLQTEAIDVGPVTFIGYASSRPEDVTGSVTQLQNKDIVNRPVLAVDQALSGLAAGVQVRANTGTPGGKMDIVVRGRGTIGDARPLYVVDGVQIGNEYRGDPSNIDQISILKDASATAIYGARGANGVIIITTKGGQAPAEEAFTTVSVDAYRGVQSTWKRIDVTDAYEYAEILNHNQVLAKKDSAFTQSQINNFSNTNWQDQVFRDAVIEKYKLQIDGGSTGGSWSTSVGYTNQEGIVRGTDYTRYDYGFKMMHKLTDKIDFGASLGFNVSTQNAVYEGNLEQSALGAALIADPTIPVYDSTGNWAAPTNSYYNPVGVIEANNANTPNITTKGFGLGGNAWLTYKIFKGFEYRTQYNYGNWNNVEEFFVPVYFIKGSQAQSNSLLSRRNQFGDNWGLTNTFTYSYKIYNADSSVINHDFRILAGHEVLYARQETDRYKIEDLLSEEESMRYFIAGTNNSEVNVNTWEAPNEHSMLSYMGRLEYAFQDKYLINGTIRRDGSSRFGAGRKFGYFPAVGVAWKVNKESFFYGNEWLKTNVSMFKIRGGWGKVGNENIGNYQFVGTSGIDANSSYSFGKNVVSGAVPLTIANEDLHWEEATSWNIGTDINMFKNKVMFNFDYFIKKNMDNLIRIAVPAIVGVDGADKNPYVNTAEILNKGYELSLTYRNQYATETMKHAFKYDVSANFTQITNEVVYQAESELPGGFDQRGNVYVANTKEGYPIASFFGYQVDGVFQNWGQVNQSAQTNAAPGDYKIVDVNGDGRISTADITYLGSPHPKFTYGFNANCGYAGFDLGFSFQGVHGNKIYNMTKWYLDGGDFGSNFSTRRLDVWSADNTGSDQPTDQTWFTGKNSLYPLSAFIEDGSYLRLKNITFGYTLPDEIAAKMRLNRCRVYTVIQNALTFTKYSGFDPEIGTNETTNWEGPEFGIDRGAYPQARSIVFGVNLEF